MDSIDCVKKKIEGIIEKSIVTEDPIHSKNTLEWVLKLKPDADEALKIAAFSLRGLIKCVMAAGWAAGGRDLSFLV